MNTPLLRLFAMFNCFGLIALLGAFAVSAKNSDEKTEKPVGKLFQVILNVEKMDAQVRFYRDVLGFSVIYPDTATDFSRESFVRLDTGGAQLALHAGRTAPNAQQEPRLSFMTEDIHATRDRLRTHGMQLGPIRSPAPGVLVIDARDPEGNALHIEARVPIEDAESRSEDRKDTNP